MSKNSRKRLIFQSPRCDLPDQAVFPVPASTWKEHEVRWKSLSEQAGNHKQDGSVLTLQPHMTPQALKLGFPSQAAARVKVLKLPDSGEELPEWLDIVASTFVNLEHLYLSNDHGESEKQEQAVDPQSPSTSLRLRRLYILYRLPRLASIDGKPVSRDERQFARPDDPNGQRVKRGDWVEDPTALEITLSQAFPCDYPLPSPRHAVEVDLDGNAHLRSKDATSADTQPNDRDCSTTNHERNPMEKSLTESITQHVTLQSPRRAVEVRLDEDSKKEATPRPAVEVELGETAKIVQPTVASATPRPTVEVELSENETGKDNETDSITGRLNAANIRSPQSANHLHARETMPLIDIDLSPNDNQDGYVDDCSPPCEMPDLDEKKEDSDSPLANVLPHKDSLELDGRFEYVDVESSAHCDWACGSLSIPYFRDPRFFRTSAENSKSRFRLGCRRRRRPKLFDPSSQKTVSREDIQRTNVNTDMEKSALEQEEAGSPDTPVIQLNDPASVDRPNMEIFKATLSPPRPKTSIQVGNSPPIPEKRTSEKQAASLFQNRPPSPLSTNSVPPSLSQRIPASESLTSPFPMQFRARTRKSLSPKRELSVTTKLNSFDEPTRPVLPIAPRQSVAPLHTISTSVEQSIPLVRVQSSPSKLGRRSGELPPPCPARRSVPSPSPTRRKKDFSKWKQQLSARTTSILDDEDDDCSSDEENLTIKEEST